MIKLKAALIIIGGILVVIIIIFGRHYLTFAQIKKPIYQTEVIQLLTGALEKANLPISGTPFIQGDTIDASISGVHVRFSLNKDIETQVRALQLVLPRLKMNGQKEQEVDLRFTKVILRS